MIFLPDVLKDLRKSRGYSLGMTSRLLQARIGYKVSRSAICHWERGDFKPSIDSLMALADLFEVEMNEFFAERDEALEKAQAEG
jgi:transcriptional regulator with XRE-family HTH domain